MFATMGLQMYENYNNGLNYTPTILAKINQLDLDPFIDMRVCRCILTHTHMHIHVDTSACVSTLAPKRRRTFRFSNFQFEEHLVNIFKVTYGDLSPKLGKSIFIFGFI